MMNKKVIIDKEKKIRVGITHGDFNGISYEIIIKALYDNRVLELFTPVIYGLSRVMSYNRKNMGLNDFNFNTVRDISGVRNGKVNLINLNEEEIRIEYGKANKVAGKYSHIALTNAVKNIKENKINVIVTAPINKETIHSDEFDFPGHTEFFANEFNTKDFLMLMVSDKLKIGTVTGHIPLKDVPEKLTEELITSKLQVLEKSLIVDFGIEKPKIAVLGLNPHAGENGKIGEEDNTIIRPAVLKAKKSGSLVFGPFPADGFFADDYTRYDAILAMYHDQGLIPFKTIAFENGVNYTAGLPIVRTSPAHGTAYDRAGKNESSEQSLRSAIYLAVDIYRNRINHEEASANPLGSNLIDTIKSSDPRTKQVDEVNE
jgi:4-hydroxythreonine-4-phosphate dehydrogenase